MDTYSLLRSKTFWLLVATFVVGVGNLFLPVLPPAVQGTATTVLLLLASYTHQLTGESTSGTN